MDKKPDYRIANGFTLSDVRIAPLNPDGTYGESVPLNSTFGEKAFVWSNPAPDEFHTFEFSLEELATPTFTGTWKARNRKEFKCYLRIFAQPFSNKVLHAMARKRARSVARKRGGG